MDEQLTSVIDESMAVDLSELKKPKRSRKKVEPEPKKVDRPDQMSKSWPLPIKGKVKVQTNPRQLRNGVIVTGPRLAEEREEQKKRRATRLKRRKAKHGSNHKSRVLKATQKRRKRGSRRKATGAV